MLWKKMPILVLLTSLLACGGCTDPGNPAVCPDGLECPLGTTCAANQNICIVGPCGNGVIDTSAGEVCDDGNLISADGCGSDCRSFGMCGDGFVDTSTGELCDDGNLISGDGCSADCRSFGMCGDGFVNELNGEECDDKGASAECDADCTVAVCGDHVFNPLAREHCDDGGDSLNCDADCSPRVCGDRYVNPEAGEQCDERGILTETCDSDCTFAVCGDGVLNPLAGEACDDGNLDNTDECNAVCKSPACTNGVQDADEADVDCGGRCGATCECGQSCSASQDCTASGVCLGDTCMLDRHRLVVGTLHTCALLDTGKVRCWGYGKYGQLGYANTSNIGDNETPAWAGDVGVGGSVVQLAAGGVHTCALLDTGKVRCWGHGTHGQLGYANPNHIGDNETPAWAGDVNVGGSVIQLAAGHAHTCALLDTGKVRCWGHGLYGQLGYGNISNVGDDETPASRGDVNVGGSVIQLAAGYYHTCALLDTGKVRCWGHGAHGRLGYSNTKTIGDNEPPASAGDVNVGGSVLRLTAGDFHTCALLDTGKVRCWGYGLYGQLGYGNTSSIGDNEPPASAGDVDVGGSVLRLAAGDFHTCALLDTGKVRCWGYGLYGQLGYGNTNNIGDTELPAVAGDVDVGGSVSLIAAGGEHTCVLLDSNEVRCWGRGHVGQLGYADTNNVGDNETPASVGNVDVGGSIIPGTVDSGDTCFIAYDEVLDDASYL